MRTIFKLSTIATLIALTGCAVIIAPNDDVQVRSIFSSDVVVGDGHITTEKRAIGTLPGLDVSGPVHVDVRVGGQPGLTVEADANLLPLLRTEAQGSNLKIWIEGNVRTQNPMRVIYTVPSLTQVRASGSGRLIVAELNGAPLSLSKSGSGSTELSGRVGNLDLNASGSGSINASGLQSGSTNLNLSGSGRMTLGQVNAESLTANVHGSGEVQASGRVQNLNARVNGSGGANLTGVSSERADLVTNGSGDISANVRQSLVAHSNGSGRITVYGNPAQRNTSGKNVQVLQ
jgi:hypothetical protein